MPDNATAELSSASEAVTQKSKDIPVDPSVLDVSLFDGEPLRSVQYLSYAGLLKGDDAITTLNILKRANHAAYSRHNGDESAERLMTALQTGFQQKLRSMDFNQLVDEGHVNNMIRDYLKVIIGSYQDEITQINSQPVAANQDASALNRRLDEAKSQYKKYDMELDYWQKNPDAIKDAIRKHPEVLQSGKYLALGNLAVTAGLIEGSQEKAIDMVDDVLADAVAHGFKLMSNPFTFVSDADLKHYQDNPKAYAPQIRALAERIALSNVPLDELHVNTDVTPEVGRVQALKNLLSAQLEAAMTNATEGAGTPDIAQQAEALTRIKPLIAEYQSAVMSLAHEFLGQGAGKDDPRMQTLRGYLENMMKKDGITLLPPAEAEAKADALAKASAEDLLQLAEGKPELTAKLKTLLTQVDPELQGAALSPRKQLIGGSIQTLLGAAVKLTQQLMRSLASIGVSSDKLDPQSDVGRAA